MSRGASAQVALARPFRPGRLGWRDVRDALSAAWAREQMLGRDRLWFAPALGAGAAIQLGLRHDPAPGWVAAVLLIALAVWFALRDRAWLGSALALSVTAALGMSAASVSVWRASAPATTVVHPAVEIRARVLRIDLRADRSPRVVLDVADMDGVARSQTPRYVALSGRFLDALAVGDTVAIRARVVPVPGPTHPDAYNPRFAAFFAGVGAYAFSLGRPRAISLPAPDMWARAWLAVEIWRTDLTRQIVARLGPETGPVAAALVTGQRTAVTEDLRADFNASGLTHVLSISGLHMALVAGGIFWLLRAGLALLPGVALRYPIKKWAAVGALAAATFYEIASGSEVATTRSYIMIAVMFTAILLDRPAVTVRNVMIAAVIILVCKPESILSASFQMSFAATIALVAGVERGLMPRFVQPTQPLPVRVILWVCQAIGVTACVSLLCEVAILPVQLHHFHRVAWFGIVGNVLALAVVDALIMPAAVLALVLLPLGIGSWVLPILGFGVDRMIDIARFVAQFPFAVTPVAGPSAPLMATALVGVLWASIWRSWIGALGALPYVAALALWSMERGPDLRVSADGVDIAVRGSDGRFALATSGRDGFTVQRWLEADGDPRPPRDAERGARCDPAGCTVRRAGGALVAVARDPYALLDDCGRADVLVATSPAPPGCDRPTLILGRQDVREAHGIAVWLGPGPPRVHTVTGACGTRPWCPDPEHPRRPPPGTRRNPQ